MTGPETRRPHVDNPDATRDEWLTDLYELLAQVRRWAEGSGWRTRVIEKSMNDSVLGQYKAPAMLMQREKVEVILDPVGRLAPGTDGVVDLYLLPAIDDIASLYLVDGAWKRWFSDFVAILDFIHALSYIFAAAMAGRTFRDGWQTYVGWIEEVWSGQVERVIAALELRQAELGQATKDDAETSPYWIIATTLGYLQNHKDRMRYDAYRCAGLPLTSCHVESTVKLFNRRVKGTEKFWSEEGAEAILQLRFDYLSENQPLNDFWERRQAEATGRRNFRKAG